MVIKIEALCIDVYSEGENYLSILNFEPLSLLDSEVPSVFFMVLHRFDASIQLSHYFAKNFHPSIIWNTAIG